MVTYLFIFALVLQAMTLAFAVWVAITTRRRLGWILLSLGFGGMVVYRSVRVAALLAKSSSSDPFDSAVSLAVSAFLLLAMVAIKVIYAERDAGERLLRESESRYRSVIDCVAAGIIILDRENVQACNPAAERLLGISRSAIVGRSRAGIFGEMVDENGEPLAPEDWPASMTFRTGETRQNVTVGVRRSGGTTLWLQLNTGVLAESAAHQGGLVVVSFQDISAEKLARESLQHRKDAAEAANASKDHFLAVLSHELRTPLAPVLSTIDAIGSEPGISPGLRQDVELLRRNVELEARLIDDLLDLTRITKGKLQLNRRRVNAHVIIRQVLEICAGEIATKGLNVTLRLEAARAHLDGDPARLQQIVWNLLKNAIKFTPAGGDILLASSGDECWCLRITDTGVGIDPGMLPSLFHAFSQGGPEIGRKYGGLGLGLAITKALVEIHGGSVTAASAGLGKGATFEVRLPLAAELAEPQGGQPDRIGRENLGALAGTSQGEKEDEPGPRLALEKARGRPSSLRVLVVDDHVDTSRSLVRLLSGMGHQVMAAGTVRGALECTMDNTYDLVISDIGLPDGSGIDFLEALRKKSSVPAIALSGFGMESDIQRSKAAGFSLHLTKPINLQALEDAIAEAVLVDF